MVTAWRGCRHAFSSVFIVSLWSSFLFQLHEHGQVEWLTREDNSRTGLLDLRADGCIQVDPPKLTPAHGSRSSKRAHPARSCSSSLTWLTRRQTASRGESAGRIFLRRKSATTAKRSPAGPAARKRRPSSSGMAKVIFIVWAYHRQPAVSSSTLPGVAGCDRTEPTSARLAPASSSAR